jgi:hypothetical protein
MRFLLLKGQSQYGSLRLHIDQLAGALRALGEDVRVIDLMTSFGTAAFVRAAVVDGADCVFAFSGVFGQEYAAVYKKLGITYASLYVDNPVHHLTRLQPPESAYVAFFLDRTHQAFMQAMDEGGAFAHLGFLPPGANTVAAPVDVSRQAYGERDIPILFSGTYRGEPERPWLNMPMGVRDLLSAVAERMVADGALWVCTALRDALEAGGIQLTPELLRALAPALSPVQLFAEAYHRNAFLDVVGPAGVAIQTVGKGWAALCERYPSFSYLGEGSFEETLDLLRRTRVVINVNNGFISGGHERVFAAMAAGTAVFSEASHFYDEVFVDGEDMVTFTTPVQADVAARLEHLAGDLDFGAQIAANGYAKTRAHHMWTNRATEIVEVVRRVRGEGERA